MKRPRIGSAVVLMPSGFTLANLACGMLAIIAAFNADFALAGSWVVWGAVLDTIDGRVARATATGSRFGEELDSLVDIISFGVAPAMIMYMAVLKDEKLGWLWSFVFIAAAAIRLARFNVEQAGKRKSHFYGLPSPAAGITLASYYWFSQTTLYTESWVGTLPWQQTMRIVMVVLAVLMMSTVQYPAVPAVGYKTLGGIIGTAVVIGSLIGALFFHEQFFFPASVAYVMYGVLKTAISGLLDRRLALDSGPDDELELANDVPAEEGTPDLQIARTPLGGVRRRRRRRRRGGGGQGGGSRPTPA